MASVSIELDRVEKMLFIRTRDTVGRIVEERGGEVGKS